ncbi:hypothetical protein DVK02_13685 [Halobellus sp. Atlit-31R]|nr:hypothetical protein DVK02_13685 [Halobellus sp. Atlit-31R]
MNVDSAAGKGWCVRELRWVTQILTVVVVAVSLGLVGTAAATDTAPTCSEVDYSTNSSGWYEVTNVSQLQCIEDNGLGEKYLLTNNISASGTQSWNNDKGFAPIGKQGSPFTGTVDGNGYTVSNLHIDRSGSDLVGLFGTVSGGTIIDLGIEDVDISGRDAVGGLVGQSKKDAIISGSSVTGVVDGNTITGGLAGQHKDGTITLSFTDTDVTGRSNVIGEVGGLAGQNWGTVTKSKASGDVSGALTVGGLVGANTNGGSITESYATGDVSTDEKFAGGLVGDNYAQGSTIADSYATGNVSGRIYIGGLVGRTHYNDLYQEPIVTRSFATGAVSGSNTGGLLGKDEGGILNDSYWDKGTTGSAGAGRAGTTLVGFGATGDTGPAAEMTGLNATIEMHRLDFDSTWRPGDGDDQYPTLAWDSGFTDTAAAYDALVAGDGTVGAPYEVEHVYDLQRMDLHLDDHFELQGDIDANGTSGWNGGAGFDPVGQGTADTTLFVGTFDGTGHTITGLTIDRGAEDYVGLFGHLYIGTVENVTVQNVSITGKRYVGGLVGISSNAATISASSVTGTLGTANRSGGLVGLNQGGTITGSTAAVTISGDQEVGGLIGYNLNGTIVASSATGDVDGSSDVGGLVGESEGALAEINQSSAGGDVNGTTRVGGIVGYNHGGAAVNDSSATGAVTGGKNVGGLIGQNLGSTVTTSSATGDVNGSIRVGGLVGYNYEGNITDSYATGGTNGSYVGGLVGTSYAGALVDSYATGDVNGSDFAGGFLGFNDGGDITTSYATGNVTGADYVGGLVGSNYLGATVTTSYATADVDGATYVGGLVAENADGADISGSYATGAVSGTDTTGGVVGLNDAGTISDSYWDIGTTNQVDAVGDGDGTNLTGFGATSDTTPASEMTGINATVRMASFDFNNTWRPGDGDSEYPELAWDSGFADTAAAYDALVVGDGTNGSPYEIEHIYDLQRMDQHLNDHFELHTDIDANGTDQWNGGSGFAPIGESDGESADAFTGEFEGAGYVISDLFIDRDSVRSVGLFGVSTGNVKNVSVVNADITGGQDVGGLVGTNSLGATVTTSYATGNVTGSKNVGGLVGYNHQSEITTSYAVVDLTGSTRVGGIVGYNSNGMFGDSAATVTASYATGKIFGSGAGVGGLVGNNDGGTVSDSYWNIESTGRSRSNGGSGLSTSQMTGTDALDSGNMEGLSASVWTTNPDTTTDRIYPTLVANPQTPPPSEPLYAGGDGTAANPYQVETWTHLDAVRRNPDANFTVAESVNASTVAYDAVANVSADGGAGFEPIGNKTTPFTGSFGGDGHTISDLHIDRGKTDYVGLFGTSTGRLENVRVENVDITGRTSVGGLVGYNVRGNATVTESYVTGDVNGSKRVGGLVGYNYEGNIAESYATVNVNSSLRLGGLVGENREGNITESYATGNLSGSEYVGGLVGANNGATISESYAAGSVDGTDLIGGFVGENNGGAVSDSYWDRGTTNQSTAIGAGPGTNLTGFGSVDDTGPASEMQGSTAVSKMSRLAFTDPWVATDGYPTLAWDATGPYFAVDIGATTAPVKAGGILTVTANVTNWGLGGSQVVTLTNTDFTNNSQDETTVSLASGESNASVNLQWATDTSDDRIGSVTVKTTNESATATVAVKGTSNTGGGGGGDSNSDISGGGDGERGNAAVPLTETTRTQPLKHSTLNAITIDFAEPVSGQVRVAVADPSTVPEFDQSTLLGAVEVTPPSEATNTNAVLRFTVDAVALEASGVTAADLVVRRIDSSGVIHDPFEVRVETRTEESVTLVTQTPGFSTFALLATNAESDSPTASDSSSSDGDPMPESIRDRSSATESGDVRASGGTESGDVRASGGSESLSSPGLGSLGALVALLAFVGFAAGVLFKRRRS